jgi:hypothetical protein
MRLAAGGSRFHAELGELRDADYSLVIPREVEESLTILRLPLFHQQEMSPNLGIKRRHGRALLDITKKRNVAILFAFASICTATAQESPAPTPSPAPEASATPLPTPQQTPSPSPTRKVRITFVPPPLEGAISLGIYDGSGNLVRVLHQQAELNEFTIGPDALVTQWDGKNDDDEDLPAGKYRAHGYLVGHFKVEDLGEATPPSVENDAATSVKVKLMPNPLANDKQSIIDLGVGFDSDGSYLKTTDDLPLLMVSDAPNLVRAFITKNAEKSIDVWQDDGSSVHQFRISNVDKMMAFDCGEFELK